MSTLVPGFVYDIFISYRHNDNLDGWVTDFVQNLDKELRSTLKNSLTIYFDKNPHDGLLETHNVDKSLEGKLKCLIFLPIISQTYCDQNSFAWKHEFCAFNKLSKDDRFGRDIKLSNGNVASRILPIKIHDLDAEDRAMLENELGGVMRAVEFIYKEPGVNRPLETQDERNINSNKIDYRNQINKTANAIKELILGLKNFGMPISTPINYVFEETKSPESRSTTVIPKTKYAKSGDINIAYQTLGKGELDLICAIGWVSNVEYIWEEPTISSFLNRLATFSRLIIFDKRGTGLSDHVSQMPTLEQRMDDVRAVMDAADSPNAALLGISEGGSMCALFAATYPERTSGLILCGSFAKRIWDAEYPWAPTLQEREKFFDAISEGWGGSVDIDTIAPSMSNDERFKTWWATYLRRSASPGAALALAKMNTEIDIRNILSSIHIPALVLHRKGDMDSNIEEARYMARKIPGAKLVEFEGNDHLPWVGESHLILDEIEMFLSGVLKETETERILTTILFTDVVGSTQKALELGDARWHQLLESYNALVRKELIRFRGREIKTAGDGFFATFDGPARAIKCACAISDGVRQLGIEIRAGLHTGECEIFGEDLRGIAVDTGSRVMSQAGASEVLVSSTVKNLVAGSGIRFQSKGKYKLTGVQGEWELYTAVV